MTSPIKESKIRRVEEIIMLHPGGNAPDMEEKYTYYAFISYKHEDEKWARWIQNKLETYKLPSVLQKESKELPSRITPIFRDKTDITSGPLKKTLSKELEASKYLIVICSPRSAKSPYVNYEVEQFISLGRQDRIIPFIVEGIVGASDPAKECYVPALLHMEETILGVDLPKLGKRKTFLTIIATMLDIKLDTLLHRDKTRRRRKNIMAAAVLTVFLVGFSFLLDYYIPKTGYYSDYALKWGLPKGINKLDTGFLFFGDNELKGKDDFYMITESKADRTITVNHVNSAKVPIDYHFDTEQNDRPVIAEYEYKVTDKIKHAAAAKYIDRYGNVMMVLKYSDDSTIVDFTSGDGSNSPMTLSSSLFAERGIIDLGNVETKSAITRYIYSYDEDGYISSVKFMRDNRSSSPTPDQYGIIGYQAEVDTYGRIRSKQMLYNYDNSLRDNVFTKISYEYNIPGQLMAVTYTDAEGNPVLNYDGYAKKEFTYNENGNLMGIYYYDNSLEPCNCLQGYSYVIIGYDARGFHKEQTFYDTKMNPVLGAFGYATEEYENDKRGNQVLIRVFDTDGNPIVALPEDTSRYTSGFSIMRNSYNNENMLIRQSYYNEKDEPMNSSEGFAALEVTYDAMDRVHEVSYFDINGEPTKCNSGFEKFIKEYNEFNLVTEWRYCNFDGTLTDTEWGFSRMVCEYDSNRNVNMLSYYDTSDRPVITSSNLARQELVWDDRGFVVAIKNYDTQGAPIISNLGYAERQSEYNDNGYMTKDANYDENGKLILVDDFGYARMEKTYDASGNCTEEVYYGADDQPAINPTVGYSRFKGRYDGNGARLEEAYYDAEGKLIIPTDMSWARHVMAYNRNGQIICESYYDMDNHLTLNNTGGYAKAFAEYDEWNNVTRITLYDTEDKVYVAPQYGYAVIETLYENNYLVRESYYDEAGNLIIFPGKNYARLIQKWDKNGNLTERSTYDEKGKPMLNLYNYSAVKYTYNRFGDETRQEFFGLKGRPVIAYDYGYSRKESRYNTEGVWESQEYYDTEGEPVESDTMVYQPIAYIQTVTPLTRGAKAGLLVNDIILKLGNWSYFPVADLDTSFAPLAEAVSGIQDNFTEIVVYRPSDSSIRIFSFEPGVIGVNIMDTTFKFPDQEAFEKYFTELEELYQNKMKE